MVSLHLFRVDQYAVMLDKNRVPKVKPTDPKGKTTLSTSRLAQQSPDRLPHSDSDNENGEYSEARWNVIPQLRRGVNRGYGAIRRPHRRMEHQNSQGEAHVMNRAELPRRSLSAEQPEIATSADVPEPQANDSDDMDVEDERDIAVVPVPDGKDLRDIEPQVDRVYRSSVRLEINDQDGSEEAASSAEPEPVASSSASSLSRPKETKGPDLPQRPMPAVHQLPHGPRLQAFAVNNSTSVNSNPKTRQLETRQRQLEMLRRMEERYKSMAAQQEETKRKNSLTSWPEQKRSQPAAPSTNSTCACQRLSVHVLDISKAITDNIVTWISLKSNSSLAAPEETILYTLTLGKGELIMFGGIQRDLSAMVARGGTVGSQESDTDSNALYFLNPPGNVI